MKGYIFCLSRENKKAFLSSFQLFEVSHVCVVNPPNLLFPADLIITKVLGILSHFE